MSGTDDSTKKYRNSGYRGRQSKELCIFTSQYHIILHVFHLVNIKTRKFLCNSIGGRA